MEVVLETPRWDLYRVLAEPVRLRLLALAAEEELAIGELAELLGENQPNVSRHAVPLRQAGLLSVRKQGTRTLARLSDRAKGDAVVLDALESGRRLCEGDGSLERIAQVLSARDALSRAFFAERRGEGSRHLPAEFGAYVAALSVLLPRRGLAVDAGTGDGGMLDVLSPAFERVVGLDRSEAQLGAARDRVAERGYDNVALFCADVDDDAIVREVGVGADVVFAMRLLHHAPKPALLVSALARLAAPGGSVVIVDYARHEDESMRSQADLWLGFEPKELVRFSEQASLTDPAVRRLPASLVKDGVDGHLPWQVFVGHKKER